MNYNEGKNMIKLQYMKHFPIYIHTQAFKSLVLANVLKFLILCSPRLHLFDQKYNKTRMWNFIII